MKRKFFRTIAILLSVFILVGCFVGCGNDSSSDTSYNSSNYKNGYLFSTECDIEDYRDGVFIATKSDGKLYGLINLDGDEITEFIYDSLEFNYHGNKASIVYAEYEGKIGVLGMDGSVLIPVTNDYVAEFDDDCLLTYTRNKLDSGEYEFTGYDVKGSKLWSFKSQCDYSLTPLGNNYIVRREVDNYGQAFRGVEIVDFDFNVVAEYKYDGFTCYVDNAVSDGSAVSFSFVSLNGEGIKLVVVDSKLNSKVYNCDAEAMLAGGYYSAGMINADSYGEHIIIGDQAAGGSKFVNLSSGEEGTEIYTDIGEFYNGTAFAKTALGDYAVIDNTGNVVSRLSINNPDKKVRYLGDVLCYSSNDTFKLIDKNGNTVGDDRYFDCYSIGDEYYYYAFMNVDGDYEVYNQNGDLIIDAGKFYVNESGGTIEEKEIIDCYASFDAIIFITAGENGLHDIMWYTSTIKRSSNNSLQAENQTVSLDTEVDTPIYPSEDNECFDFELIGESYQVIGYSGSDKNVTIPSVYNGLPVTQIGDFVFAYCEELESVNIPGSVSIIGYGAFDCCNHLTTINIAEGVTEICERAFSNCVLLDKVTIPNSVTNIGVCAFEYCRSLSSINIPNGIKNIEFGTFAGCYSLKSITIPDSVVFIDCYAFDECTIEIIAPHDPIYYSFETQGNVTWSIKG